ncbi:MAG: L,D-transpeptidase family protein [Oscillospiraceae bacterium]|nr:L,D-transpeptidase family protein [Oscillospiraceae bacterium]
MFKKFRRIICIVTLAVLIMTPLANAASFSDYSDVKGHWAEYIMRWAYDDGLINGRDGYLLPDESITGAQALTILCRLFNAEGMADISDTKLITDAWFYEYAEMGVYLGLTTSADVIKLNKRIIRQDAFYMLAEAFQLIEVDPDMSALDQYSDSGLVSAVNRRAMASLISKGIITGYGGVLNVNDETTRATFLSVLYRIVRNIVPASAAKGSYDNGTLLHGRAGLYNSKFNKGIWFDCATTEVLFDNVTADSAVIRSNMLETLVISGKSNIGQLTLAMQSGNITVDPEEGSVVGKLIAGSGRGIINVGSIKTVDITGSGRDVIISGNVDSVVISGSNSSVTVLPGAVLGKITLLVDAVGSKVIADGNVTGIEVRAMGATVGGIGTVNAITLRRADTVINVAYGKLVENVDFGLEGATVTLSVPEKITAGDTLSATASIDNAVQGVVCEMTWYLDGAVETKNTVTVGKPLPELTKKYEISREGLPESVDIKVEVKYVTSLGEKQELFAAGSVVLENFDKAYWMKRDAPKVLEKVTLGYKGDFTLQWALDHDLDDYEKEVWVNAKGYTSRTQYLLWVNLAYQRVNIFQKVDNSWELIRTCIVGTGAPGMGTPVGVWTTTYKQKDGWNTSSYTVKPVVRFRDGSAYAFHSRLYYPGSSTLLDPNIGFPISHGCVRMYDEDVWYIHDNIPDGTTVVVY